MYGILEEIKKERARQNAMWGEQNHSPEFWLAILGEEHGEVCKAVCERKPEEYRKELIHVAAVCVQMCECFDRNKK